MVCSCMSPSLCVYCGISLAASFVAVLISSFVSSNALLTACCCSFCTCDGDGVAVSSSLRSFLLIDIIILPVVILYKTMVSNTIVNHTVVPKYGSPEMSQFMQWRYDIA